MARDVVERDKAVVRGESVWRDDGAPERTRTSDARFRKPTLYPLSYGGVQAIVARATPE